MIFNTSGGGGTALNFKVVGNPQPASAKENTIWIDTDTTITSWLFSATEPSPAEAGMVWITIGTSSSVEFNALKKHGIQVYPISAKQYIGGAWVDKTAKSYQGGAWIDWWNGELFDNGNQYTGITGGWVQADYTLDSSDTARGGTCTIGSSIVLTAGTLSNCVSVRTKNKIDLTDWSWIKCEGSQENSGSSSLLLVAKDTSGATNNTTQIPAATGVNALDISGLDGEWYIGSMARQAGTNTLTKIWLER